MYLEKLPSLGYQSLGYYIQTFLKEKRKIKINEVIFCFLCLEVTIHMVVVHISMAEAYNISCSEVSFSSRTVFHLPLQLQQ